MPPVLYCLPYSPWSLKAEFALRHHRVEVARRVYRPLLSAPELRLRLRKLGGKVTVPVLFTDEGPITDSFEIALYAERVGKGAPLLPESKRAAIADWNACSERLLSAGRARAMVRASGDLDAAYESLPKVVSAVPVLGPAFARSGLTWFKRKYEILEGEQDANAEAMRAELLRLRSALGDGRRYLLGDFSHADVVMAFALQGLRPLPQTPLGPAMRRAMTDEQMCAEHPDLLRWRDDLQRDHELLPATSSSARAA
jgi:glutathione S-transferase